MRNMLENFVTRCMAVSIIDVLETVQVHSEQCYTRTMLGPLDTEFEVFQE